MKLKGRWKKGWWNSLILSKKQIKKERTERKETQSIYNGNLVFEVVNPRTRDLIEERFKETAEIRNQYIMDYFFALFETYPEFMPFDFSLIWPDNTDCLKNVMKRFLRSVSDVQRELAKDLSKTRVEINDEIDNYQRLIVLLDRVPGRAVKAISLRNVSCLKKL